MGGAIFIPSNKTPARNGEGYLCGAEAATNDKMVYIWTLTEDAPGIAPDWFLIPDNKNFFPNVSKNCVMRK